MYLRALKINHLQRAGRVLRKWFSICIHYHLVTPTQHESAKKTEMSSGELCVAVC